MTTVEQYVDFLKQTLSISISPTQKDQHYTNNLIGALVSAPGNFDAFKAAFVDRVDRVFQFFKGTSNEDTILNLLNQLATDEWAGSWSELVAYDAFIQINIGKIELDKTLCANESYAADMGKSNTNEDIYLPQFNTYMDVKRFSDPITHIIKSIIKKAEEATPCGSRNILSEITHNIHEDDIRPHIGRLIKELSDYLIKIGNEDGKYVRQSKILPNLSFRIMIGSGVNSSEGFYGVYHKAELYRDFILERYTNKIMKDKPFFLVFVNFPWDNPIDNDSFGSNQHLYRALARRTFMQYRHNTRTAQEICGSDYTGTDTPYDISRHISGLIFIDDHSIKNEGMTCYLYTNPNADNPSLSLKITYGEFPRGLKATYCMTTSFTTIIESSKI